LAGCLLLSHVEGHCCYCSVLCLRDVFRYLQSEMIYC
jgi:hypothetical protein